MDIWFTSDLHLGHKNVLAFQDRPFDNIEEMNAGLLSAINKRVKACDILYILGDVAYKNAGVFCGCSDGR